MREKNRPLQLTPHRHPRKLPLSRLPPPPLPLPLPPLLPPPLRLFRLLQPKHHLTSNTLALVIRQDFLLVQWYDSQSVLQAPFLARNQPAAVAASKRPTPPLNRFLS